MDRPSERPSLRTARPGRFFAAGWSVLLLLTVYSAEDVRNMVLDTPWLDERPWAVRAADRVTSLAESTGLGRLRARVDALSGGDPSLETTDAPVDDTPADDTEDEDGDAAPGQAASEPIEVAPPPSVGPDQPAKRILLIGASSMQFALGVELERLLSSSYEDVTVLRVGKAGTGLSRSDVIDWPKKAEALIEEFKPDLVVANFGGNDAQGIVVQAPASKGQKAQKQVFRFRTPEWDREYAARLQRIVDAAHSRGSRMVLIGMPIMKQPSFSEKIAHVNAVTEQVAQQTGSLYLSSWNLSTTPDGAYQKTVHFLGKTGPMRHPDGHHYTQLGGMYVAEHLVWRLERHVVLVHKDTKLGVAMRRDVRSEALQRTVSYMAYMPRQLWPRTSQCRPALFLLHGAQGDWSDWSEHAHRTLQELAQQHGLVLITPEGGSDGWYLDSDKVPGSHYASHLTKELWAETQHSLPITRQRSMGGISAGGHGAITLALENPGQVVAASSISGVLDLTEAGTRKALIARLGPLDENRAAWEAHSALHMVQKYPERAKQLPMLLSVGESDRWAPANRRFHEQLDALGVAHQFEVSPGGHDWDYWARQLPIHVAWHAKQLEKAEGARDARCAQDPPPSP